MNWVTILADASTSSMGLMEGLIKPLISASVFVLLGVVIFAISMLVIIKMCPFSFRKEIEEDQNIALAIIVASIMIGLSIVIAAAIHG